jgi:hypothetical protein
MKMRWLALGAMAAVLAAGGLAACDKSGGAKPAASTAAVCDRACLVGIMQTYLGALPKHSTAGVPLADKVKFTEQAAPIPVGDGLWLSATEAPAAFKIIAADPTSGQVGAIVTMKEWDKPILLAARLKVADGKITEIENVISRDLRPAALANLQTPRPALLEDVPAAERTARDQMLAAAFAYFDSIEQDDGGVAPFADDCTRHENGLQTTNNKTASATPLDGVSSNLALALAKLTAMTCADSMSTQSLQYITMVRPRHLLIVDEQKGLVFGFPRFVHRGDNRHYTITGVPGVDAIDMPFGPSDLQASEMFKIRSGKIHEIEATGFINAYMAPTGWDAEYPETYAYDVTHPKTHPYTAGTSFPAK